MCHVQYLARDTMSKTLSEKVGQSSMVQMFIQSAMMRMELSPRRVAKVLK